MSSAFSIGKRIALDYLFKDSKDINKIKKELDYINNNTKNDLHLSSHFITVDDKGWDAVVKYDRFFKNVEVIKTNDILNSQYSKLKDYELAYYFYKTKDKNVLEYLKIKYILFHVFLLQE